MASHLLRVTASRLVARRLLSTSQPVRVAGPAMTDDPNVNVYFREDMINPLPLKPRLWCTTPELKALKAKEAGNWKNLTEEDMKQLYDAYFGMRISDMERPTDNWKSYVGVLFYIAGFTLFLHLFIHVYINPPYVSTVTDQEWINASIKKMIQQHQGDVTGYSSKWDYENNTWKK
ncbi:cytochrome c oxidase subunit 4 isoform 1, mitochondrial-like [Styela clava]|uniref:cytochrome c oxidase subunit 4 isoform 1, mitochondrial-like n=1 Tax=Styela clava TaxID=7725 RepID=UPI0019399DF0|nr:cytochrome c oxidase subunit 4 isoform 1, mitochondrial-like [Styela clava]